MKHLIRMGLMLAAAMMLCLTSCLNETTDTNSEADYLPVNVAALSDQVAAMKISVDEINSVQALLADAEQFDAVAAQFETCATALEEHIAYVDAGLSGVDAVLAAINLQGEIAHAIGTLNAQMALISADVKFEKIASGVVSLENSVKSWLGKDFENYFEVAIKKAELESMLAMVETQSLSVDAIMSDLEAGLRLGDASGLEELVAEVTKSTADLSKLTNDMSALCSELQQAYIQAVKSDAESKAALKSINAKAAAVVSETGTTLADLGSRISACETALADIDARLEKVEADVAELLGMIQSLTFISDFSEENAYAYYNMDVNTKVSDSNLPYYGKAQRTATGTMELTYMVRPAAAAAALNANTDAVKVVGYYAKSIETKAPQASDYFDLGITKVAVVNEARGLVTVTVTPNFREAFYYKEIGAKCALSVTSGTTDVTSRFVEILPKDNSTTIYATGVTPNRLSVELDKGESLDLSAVVYPSNAVQVCYWTSSNNNIASFNGSTMTANEVGNTTVKVTTSAVDEWGLPLVAEIPVKVNEAIRLTGQGYVEVGYTADMFLDYPKTAIIESKVWSTSDPSKLTVDQNGKVTGVADTYNTTTKAYSQVTVSCTINGVTTVSWPMYVAATQPRKLVISNLADNQSEISLRVNESLSLASTIYPENVPAGAYKIIYQSDQGLGWINYDTGLIDANRNTYATTAWVTITVENYDKEQYYITDSRVKRVIAVKVIPYYVKTISLSDVEIEIGQAAVMLTPTLTSDVAGKAPTNSALTWTSSNEAIATVDQNGKVTPVAPGNATITATAQDGSGVSGSCTVTVTQPWKEFNVGDYVVRKSLTKEIEFYSDLTTAQNAGYVVGIVISKTNPRATDPMLPESCTHGIAIALGEGEGTWASNDSQRVSEWAAQSGQAFVSDVNVYSGYTNTQALKAFISAKGASSGIISALNTYNQNGPGLPNGTSTYYIPSAAAMKDIANLSGGNMNFSNKLTGIGGTALSNAVSGSIVYYWTVSEVQTTPAQAVAIRGLMYQSTNKSKTSSSKTRYVFAF